MNMVLDLSTATTLEIHYRDPEGITGVLEAEVKDIDNNVAVAEITVPLNEKYGEWKFEIYAVLDAGDYFGTTFSQKITAHFK